MRTIAEETVPQDSSEKLLQRDMREGQYIVTGTRTEVWQGREREERQEVVRR